MVGSAECSHSRVLSAWRRRPSRKAAPLEHGAVQLAQMRADTVAEVGELGDFEDPKLNFVLAKTRFHHVPEGRTNQYARMSFVTGNMQQAPS